MMTWARYLLVTGLLAGSVGCGNWRQVDSFCESLSCGLNREEILSVAKKHGITEPPEAWAGESGDCSLLGPQKGLKFVKLSFIDDTLESVQQLSKVPFSTRIKAREQINLCTGESAVCTNFEIRGPGPYDGATVSVNGQVLGELTVDPYRDYSYIRAWHCLPVGEAIVEIEKPGLTALCRSVRFQYRGRWINTNNYIRFDLRKLGG